MSVALGLSRGKGTNERRKMHTSTTSPRDSGSLEASWLAILRVGRVDEIAQGSKSAGICRTTLNTTNKSAVNNERTQIYIAL